MSLSGRYVPVLFTALCAIASVGCPATPLIATATPGPKVTETSLGGAPTGGTISNSRLFQYIDGTVVAPAGLANGGNIIEAERIDFIEAGGRKYALTQASASPPVPSATPAWVHEKPVHFALMSVRSYEMKTIPELPSSYSTDQGRFLFDSVPSQIAFFVEGQFETKSGTYQLLGLTRTEDAGKTTKVIIDSASTMTARELMRMWQMSGYRVSFKNLDPRDFNPLLQRLRKKLQAGFPAGVNFDPSKVTLPDGPWSWENDKKDSALVSLDQIADGDEAISREIDRLYLAVNYSLTRVRDASRAVIKRPATLTGSAPTPSPTPTPAAVTTPRPQTLINISGTVNGVTAPASLRFIPDPTQDEDGAPTTTTTDAAGNYALKVSVGASDLAAFYTIVLVQDKVETKLGTFRVYQDKQVLPAVDAPK